jgi:hypothetical protein
MVFSPMPTMRLDLALLFVFDFALLNLYSRNRDYTRCEPLESFEGCF